MVRLGVTARGSAATGTAAVMPTAIADQTRPDQGRSVGLTPRSWLMGQDPVAELHRDRHAEVGRCICNLIGV